MNANTNAFISFLLTLSVRQHVLTPTSPWKFRLETLAFSAILHLWRIYKTAYRTITGQGSIERLCNLVPATQTLRTDEKRIELEGWEVKNIVWRIEFRLSVQLADEYTTILDVARAQSESDDVCSSELSTVAGEIASVVQQKKKMDSRCLVFLGDTITCLILLQTGKQRLIRLSNEPVTSNNHRDLLDEIWLAVIIPDQRPVSDSQSELTLVDEKEYGKETVDWVKLGFQGKSPETDFRATGVLGLKQLHSFCTTYPVLARRIVTESGSSQSLQISEPWYPFALVGIHVTRTIIETLSAGLLQKDIITKAYGNLVKSVDRTCQDIYDRLIEEFHAHWMELVKIGIVKNVFDFERVYGEFKRSKGML